MPSIIDSEYLVPTDYICYKEAEAIAQNPGHCIVLGNAEHYNNFSQTQEINISLFQYAKRPVSYVAKSSGIYNGRDSDPSQGPMFSSINKLFKYWQSYIPNVPKVPFKKSFNYITKAFSDFEHAALMVKHIPALGSLISRDISNSRITSLTIYDKATLDVVLPLLLEALSNNFTLRRLRFIDIDFTTFDALYNAASMTKLLGDKLYSVEFYGCTFSEEFFQAVVAAVAKNSCLQELSFPSDLITSRRDEADVALSPARFNYLLEKMKHHRNLKRVSLFLSSATETDQENIKENIEQLLMANEALDALNLHGYFSINAKQQEDIFQFLSSKPLIACRFREFSIEGVSVRDEFAKSLAVALSSLTSSDINNSRITSLTIYDKATLDVMLPLLLEALPNNFTLKKIRFIDIKFKTFDALYNAASMTKLLGDKLYSVEFNGCTFTEEFFQVVVAAVAKNNSLRELSFPLDMIISEHDKFVTPQKNTTDAALSPTQLDYLLEKMRYHSKLRKISLYVRDVTETNLENIKQLITANEALEVLDLHGHFIVNAKQQEDILRFLDLQHPRSCRLRQFNFGCKLLEHPLLLQNEQYSSTRVVPLYDQCVSFFRNPMNKRKVINKEEPQAVTEEQLNNLCVQLGKVATEFHESDRSNENNNYEF